MHETQLYAFAAVRRDGYAVWWGLLVQSLPGSTEETNGVVFVGEVHELAGQFYAFAAVRTDGTVSCWGDAGLGGDCSAMQAQLTSVATLFGLRLNGAKGGFAALRRDASVVAWGSVSQQSALAEVKAIAATWDSFTALHMNGSLTTWGRSSHIPEDITSMTNITHVHASAGAYCAIREDGTIGLVFPRCSLVSVCVCAGRFSCAHCLCTKCDALSNSDYEHSSCRPQ